jgi:hypothetical protein
MKISMLVPHHNQPGARTRKTAAKMEIDDETPDGNGALMRSPD